jgi:group I intron endonuclease
MGCVYKVTNRVNGKIYIEKTLFSIDTRKECHESYARDNLRPDCMFLRAIRKYGKDSFIWETIFESINESELFSKKIELIRSLNRMIPDGYNMTIGGEETSEYSFTQEQRARISQALTGKKYRERSLEHRNRISEGIKESWIRRKHVIT